VNDLQTLIRLLETHPYNPVLVAMAVDELMSAKDMDRSEAERYVARLQEVAQEAAEMSFVTDLFARVGKRRLLMSALRRQFSIHRSISLTVLFVPRSNNTVMTRYQQPRVGCYRCDNVLVTVQAGWAIKQMGGLKEFERRHR
jgi:hypothetical protein